MLRCLLCTNREIERELERVVILLTSSSSSRWCVGGTGNPVRYNFFTVGLVHAAQVEELRQTSVKPK